MLLGILFHFLRAQHVSPVSCASFKETGTVRKQCQAYFTLGFALRIQEEISRIPVDVLHRAMIGLLSVSSVMEGILTM